jgi:hypothetical protein
MKARAIGVVGVDLAVLAEDQRVGRPDQRSAVGDDVGNLKDRLLVRDGDVQPDKAQPRQGPDQIGRSFGAMSMGCNAP